MEYFISILDGQSYKYVHGQIIIHHHLYQRQEKLHVSNCLLCVWTAIYEYLFFLGFSNCVLMDYYINLKLNEIDKYKFLTLSIHLTKTNEISFIKETSHFLYLNRPFNLHVDILCRKNHSFIYSNSSQYNVIIAILLPLLLCILVYPYVVRGEYQ